MKKRSQKNNGFSLIELIVSFALFTFAIMIGSGLVLAISTAQKKAVSLQEIQDNMGFAFEAMSREIRTGKNYYCGASNSDFSNGEATRDCAGGGPSFSFKNQTSETVVYRVVGGRLEKSSDGGANFLIVTSDKVNIDNIKFYVSGTAFGDNVQPKVIVVMSAKAGEKFVLEINLQTTLSQRIVDF